MGLTGRMVTVVQYDRCHRLYAEKEKTLAEGNIGCIVFNGNGSNFK